VRDEIARRRARWAAEKVRRAGLRDGRGRLHPALVFEVLGRLAPEDAVIAVDVGNNTYSFGRYFETKPGQTVVMSGYLGSIGFGLPAAMGAWAATSGTGRRIVSLSGDGGLGQYLAEVTTAVKYGMAIVHVVLNNGELAKITREQVGALRPVWQTSLHNPNFAEYARLCGATGIRVSEASELDDAFAAALAVDDGPVLLEVLSSARDV
jgi:thiamine pyrophosphate-dependent acetolactate synthase large subunit-like protein